MALELKMSIRELGERMSAHELTVVWPAYFAVRQFRMDRDDASRPGA
jgi:hypothetical protein